MLKDNHLSLKKEAGLQNCVFMDMNLDIKMSNAYRDYKTVAKSWIFNLDTLIRCIIP